MDPHSIGIRWQVLKYLVTAPQVLRGLSDIYRGEDRVKGCVQVSLTLKSPDTGWIYGSFESVVLRYSLERSMLHVMDPAPGFGTRSARCLVPAVAVR
jgi:hypothetical protein